MTSNEPVVVLLATFNLSPILTLFSIPTPPSTTKAPLSFVVDSVVLLIVVTPLTPRVLSKLVVPPTFRLVPTLATLPILIFPSTPIPPSTTKAPLSFVVDSVMLVIVVTPLTPRVLSKLVVPLIVVFPVILVSPPTFRLVPTLATLPILIFPSIPTPPSTTKAPLSFVVDSVVLLIVVTPVTPKVLPKVVAPVTPRVPAIDVLPEVAITLNLLVFTDKLPATPKVLPKVVAPVTPRVPPIVVSFVIARLCSVANPLTANVLFNTDGP